TLHGISKRLDIIDKNNRKRHARKHHISQKLETYFYKIFVVIDSIDDLLYKIKSKYTNYNQELEKTILGVLENGSEVNIHFIITNQYIDAFNKSFLIHNNDLFMFGGKYREYHDFVGNVQYLPFGQCLFLGKPAILNVLEGGVKQ